MANGQTIIKFGDVILYRCTTKRFEQRPIMDSANVNLKNWRFNIQVSGYLHGFPNGAKYQEVIGNAAASKASSAHQQIRWRLSPREVFKMAVGCTSADITSGTVILLANPMTAVTGTADLVTSGLSNYDVDDGPRCTQFDIVHVSGDNVFKVEAGFEINVVQCDDDTTATGNTTGVLSHRWSSIDSLDHNLRLTRTYRGLLEIATSNFNPHWFRYLVSPALQPGMRRDHMEFIATEDGKKLQYTITDTEVAISAPPPARKWSVEHTEQTLNQDGLKVTTQVSVALEGDSDVDKGELITLGLYIVSAKIQGSKPGQPPNPTGPVFFNDISITDLTGDVNAVRVAASCWRPAKEVDGLAIRIDGFDKAITAADLPSFSASYDPFYSAGGYPSDSPEYSGPIPLTGLFRAYLQTRCSAMGGISNENQGGDGDGGIVAAPMDPARLRGQQFILEDPSPPGTGFQVSADDGGEIVGAGGIVGAGAENSPLVGAGGSPFVSSIIVPTIIETDVSWFSESHNAAIYTTWQMESIYKVQKMRAALPIAKTAYTPTTVTMAAVQIVPPQARRIVRVQAERVGDWPEFPDPETMEFGVATAADSPMSPITQTLLKTKLLGGTTTISADGQSIYRASAEYTFALSRQPSPEEILRFGINKWSSTGVTKSSSTLTNSSFY